MSEDKLLPSLNASDTELEKQLLEETDVDNIKAIIDIFNLNIKRKDIIRANKLNELQDRIYNIIDDRLENSPETFGNKVLLEYFKTVQDTINKSEINSEDVVAPKIQLNQNNLNINMGHTLNRDSRQNVLDAIKTIINNQDVIQEENNDNN